MQHLTILGGGPAGLSVAYYAHQYRLDFHLIEKSRYLGGLCQTLVRGSHRYDTGAHRFHDRDPEITRDLKELLGDELAVVDRPSKVWLRNRLVDFPPTPLGIIRSLGIDDVAKMSLDLLWRRSARKKVVSFEDFAVRNFGMTLARRFLLNYSEKVWGLPADRLSPMVATRRLTGMNLRTLCVELFASSRSPSHLDGRFLYPRSGYGRIAQKIVESLPRSKLRVRSKVTVFDVEKERICGVRVNGGLSVPVKDRVVSTLPLTVVVGLLSESLPKEVVELARELRFRDVRLLFLRLSLSRFSENASIYIPNPEICVSRLYEPKNRSEAMAPPHETALVAEVPCFPGEEASEMTDEELSKRVLSDLSKLNLLERKQVIEIRHHRLPKAYPVYALGYAEQVETILEELKRFENLHIFGRNGLFSYSHFHDQLRWGKDFIRDLT